MKLFDSGKRRTTFEADPSLDPQTLRDGIKSESGNAKLGAIVSILVFIAGIAMILLDIRDDGTLFEITIDGTSIKYIGSSVGIIIMIIGYLIYRKSRLNIKIKK